MGVGFVWFLALLVAGPLAAPTPAQDGGLNTMCPVMPDEPASDEYVVDYNGRRIAFCCNMCRRDFAKEPQAYLAALESVEPAEGEDPPTESADGGTETVSAPPDGGGPTGVDAGATPAGADRSAPTRGLLEFLGRFHVLLVHFPIALILAAALAELALVLRPGWSLEDAGQYCLFLGALGAIAAASTGWLRAETATVPAAHEEILFWHRWLGVTTAVLALATAWLGRQPGRAGDRRPYRVGLLLCAVVVGFGAHYGGLLVYGPDYFAW